MESPISSATVVRNATPATRSLRCSAGVLCVMLTSTPLPHDPDRGRGAPDREAQEEVGDDDGDDAGPDRTADGHADPGRAARGGAAVVAVDEDHRDRKEHQLEEGPQHVDRWQELEEVVVIRPG